MATPVTPNGGRIKKSAILNEVGIGPRTADTKGSMHDIMPKRRSDTAFSATGEGCAFMRMQNNVHPIIDPISISR